MLFQVNGKKIERARLALALSQDELAAKAGISDRTVRRLESGEQTTARMVSIESIAGVLGEPAQAFLQGAAQKASRRAPATPAPAVLVARAPRSRMETLVELAADQPRPEPVRVGKERVPALTVKEYQDLFTAHAVHVGARFWVEGQVARQRGTPEPEESAALASRYGATARFGVEQLLAPGAVLEVTVHARTADEIRALQELVPKGRARVVVRVVAVADPAQPAFRFFGSDGRHPWALVVESVLGAWPAEVPARKKTKVSGGGAGVPAPRSRTDR